MVTIINANLSTYLFPTSINEQTLLAAPLKVVQNKKIVLYNQKNVVMDRLEPKEIKMTWYVHLPTSFFSLFLYFFLRPPESIFSDTHDTSIK